MSDVTPLRLTRNSAGNPVGFAELQSGEKIATALLDLGPTDSRIVASDVLRQRSIWHREGTVLSPGQGADAGAVQEVTVLPALPGETPHVLTGYTAGTPFLRGWYTGNDVTLQVPSICYFEGYDPKNLVKYTSAGQTVALLTGLMHTTVSRIGSAYYIVGAATSQPTRLDIYSSPDGFSNWQVVKQGALYTSGGWCAQQIGNCQLAVVGGSIYLFYDGLGTNNLWSVGYATVSADMQTVTPYAGNPIISSPAGMRGGIDFHQLSDGTFYATVHGSNSGTSLPTDLYAYTAPALTGPWTQKAAPVLQRVSDDDGANSPIGQAADSWTVPNWQGRALRYYETTRHSDSAAGRWRIKLATAYATLDQVAAMPYEGADTLEPVGQVGLGALVDFSVGTTYAGSTAVPDNANGAVELPWGNVTRGPGLYNANQNLPGQSFTNGYQLPRQGIYDMAVQYGLHVANAQMARVVIQFFADGTYLDALEQDFSLSSTRANVVRKQLRAMLTAGTTIHTKLYVFGTGVTISNDPIETKFSMQESR